MHKLRRALIASPFTLAALPQAQARAWQAKRVRITVPCAPGGAVDVVTREMAVSGSKRLAALPDVPTFAEAGVKGFGVINFTGL